MKYTIDNEAANGILIPMPRNSIKQIRLWPEVVDAINRSIKGTRISPTAEANAAILSYYANGGRRRKK